MHKSTQFWSVHLGSDTHQETLERLRQLKRAAVTRLDESAVKTKKLKTTSNEFAAPPPLRHRKTSDSEHSESVTTTTIEASKVTKRKHSNDDAMETTIVATSTESRNSGNDDTLDTTVSMNESTLPAGFFDSPSVNTTTTVNDNTTTDTDTASSNTQHLPKGFFDDANQETKVRRELGIESTKPPSVSEETMDMEWKRFQEALGEDVISTDNVKSTATITATATTAITSDHVEQQEDDNNDNNEESTLDDDLDPLALLQRRWEAEEEEMQDWRIRLDQLQARAAETRSQLAANRKQDEQEEQEQDEEQEDDSDNDDIDLDDLLLDWRTQQLS
ncbi:hypothetical protein BDF22DRAFT_702785 [Syncephalis plumigaleata]|nr:hypothetical protein BDF22DRAFT_702785 [Syncephalis plumigaleata]